MPAALAAFTCIGSIHTYVSSCGSVGGWGSVMAGGVPGAKLVFASSAAEFMNKHRQAVSENAHVSLIVACRASDVSFTKHMGALTALSPSPWRR